MYQLFDSLLQFDATGKYLLVANQDTNHLCVFTYVEENGIESREALDIRASLNHKAIWLTQDKLLLLIIDCKLKIPLPLRFDSDKGMLEFTGEYDVPSPNFVCVAARRYHVFK